MAKRSSIRPHDRKLQLALYIETSYIATYGRDILREVAHNAIDKYTLENEIQLDDICPKCQTKTVIKRDDFYVCFSCFEKWRQP